MEKIIREKILKIMKRDNISYGELSKRTKLSKSTLQRYITKEDVKVPIDRLSLIASGLSTTPAYLMGWTDSEFEIENRPDALIENYEENAKYILEHEDKELLKTYKDLILDENLVLLVKKASKLSPEDVVQLLKIVNTFDVDEDK